MLGLVVVLCSKRMEWREIGLVGTGNLLENVEEKSGYKE